MGMMVYLIVAYLNKSVYRSLHACAPDVLLPVFVHFVEFVVFFEGKVGDKSHEGQEEVHQVDHGGVKLCIEGLEDLVVGEYAVVDCIEHPIESKGDAHTELYYQRNLREAVVYDRDSSGAL